MRSRRAEKPEEAHRSPMESELFPLARLSLSRETEQGNSLQLSIVFVLTIPLSRHSKKHKGPGEMARLLWEDRTG